jgi:hypothetical protein
LHYAVDSGVVEGAGGYWADGGDGHAILQDAEPLFAGKLEEAVHGAGAEEEDGVGFAAGYAGEALPIGVDRTDGSIGDDFVHLRAIFGERQGEIRIGAVATRKEHAVSSDALAQLLREGDTQMGLRGVFDGETGLPSLISCGWSYDSDVRRRGIWGEVTAEVRGASDYGLDGECAGEHHPIEAVPL